MIDTRTEVAQRRPSAVAAVLLAAGRSSRMDRPKGLLDWGGKPLLLHQLDTLAAAGIGDIIIVLGHEADAYADLLQLGDDRGALQAELQAAVQVVHNRNYDAGKCSSIRAGLQAVPAESSGVLLVAVDQPLQAATVRSLLRASAQSGQTIAVPVFAGRRGHPVWVAAARYQELSEIDEASQGLRGLLATYAAEIADVVVDDPTVRLDLNTPAAYQRARATLGRDG